MFICFLVIGSLVENLEGMRKILFFSSILFSFKNIWGESLKDMTIFVYSEWWIIWYLCYFQTYFRFLLKRCIQNMQMQSICRWDHLLKVGQNWVWKTCCNLTARSQEWVKELPVCNRSSMGLWRSDSMVLSFHKCLEFLQPDWRKHTACFSKTWRVAKRAKLKISLRWELKWLVIISKQFGYRSEAQRAFGYS